MAANELFIAWTDLSCAFNEPFDCIVEEEEEGKSSATAVSIRCDFFFSPNHRRRTIYLLRVNLFCCTLYSLSPHRHHKKKGGELSLLLRCC